MGEVKWIKIVTDIFDDEKILLIESLPEADSIIVIWFKLLCLAGKQNNSGVFVMNNGLAYTDKMLATIFRRKEATVNLALRTFEEFGMIEIINDAITIPNWSKHQTLDQLEERKEYMRNYMQKYREKQRLLTDGDSKVNCKVNSKANVNTLDKDIDKNKNKKKDIKKYGEYQNVFFTDEQYEKLINEFPNDYDSRIEKLDFYIQSTGKKYKDCLATIRNWARNEKVQKKGKAEYGNVKKSNGSEFAEFS